MARSVKQNTKESTLQRSAIELKEHCTYPDCGNCIFLCEGWGGYGVDCSIGLKSNKYIKVIPKNWRIEEAKDFGSERNTRKKSKKVP